MLLVSGEIIEGSEDEADDDNTEEFEKEQWAKLEEEKTAILANKNMLAEVT